MSSTTKPSIIPEAAADSARPAGEGWLTGLARQGLMQRLALLRDGEIRLQDDGETHRFGARTARCGLSVTLTVRDPQFWSLAAYGGTVGAGESYIHGHWRCDDLTSLVRIMVLNRHVMEDMEGGLAARGGALLRRLLHWANRNSRRGSARNIAAHYDLGNDLYRLMLDDTMAYSCGIYLTEDATLREASIAKFDAVCRKLALTSSDHLVEIGTGWGGLAIHAAENYGCRVTTTTISREQHDFAKEKIAARGLSDRITLLFEDYRDLRGQFDKLVSIEMIEAVGARYLDTYFAKCSSLLKPTGAMMLQAITLQDQFYDKALKSVDYIQRFIFPGSFIPSVTAIADSVTRVTDMKLFNLEDIGPHYAPTLKAWRERFFANIDKVRALGYPESFNRLWEFYLCYCEGGFAERQLGNVQMLLTKPDCRRAAIAAG
ncbi:MAG: class I SAM-dependent methyltransferase [Proteobacteria bacterium]|jgi:cyclopropane-fatty-acyl-phospholipid synthase|nr:class I SAM-dependent methyltransferase [Pseudomonadota bacterium]MBK9251207.1 class I SAM-dependent methyltransferase [Pseudomonadota bacterium]MCC6632657.1 class I SAM-dependent methyltransferase [Gammaproteobacteria bacterium]